MMPNAAEAEALRLIKAFYRIKDPAARRLVVSLTEAAAQGVRVAWQEPDEPQTWDGTGSSA